MSLLPQEVDDANYWQAFYKEPLPFWQPALQEIAIRYTLSPNGWERAALGRNIVFLNPSTVIKLGPPHWPGEMAREAAALQFVTGRLPVTTPALIATGTLDSWDYLVEERLPGMNLRDLWKEADANTKAALAYQHGELMAALHALPPGDLPESLHFDWAGMVAYQLDAYADEMRTSGVTAQLVEQAGPYLASTPWEIEKGTVALLHGDLNSLNLMVEEKTGQWTITGLIDWGDVKIGPPSHEFISPGAHMYRGDKATLDQWYQGYRLPEKQWAAAHQHVIMTRTMLYYADNFAKQIENVPGAAACTDWPAIASVFWRMDPD